MSLSDGQTKAVSTQVRPVDSAVDRFRGAVLAIGLLLASNSIGHAQGYGVGYPFSGGSSAYVPYGGVSGGFIPLSGGPGGGLGVQPRPVVPMGRVVMPSVMTGSTMPTLGAPRGTLFPLRPLGLGRGGMGGGLMPSSRLPRPGVMGTMGRPPVGNYPFRVPPSLLVPTTGAPAMSM